MPQLAESSLTISDGTTEYLQCVANYRAVRKALRPAGIGSIVFGLIAVLLGAAGIQQNPVNAILAIIGLFLVVEGSWLLVKPKPLGFILDGLALLCLGLWNMFITISNSAPGAQPGAFGALGIWQIAWGVRNLQRYSQIKMMPETTPSDETLRDLDTVVKDIRKTKVSADPNRVDFAIKAFPSSQTWRGRLTPGMGIFVGSNHDVVVAGPPDVDISTAGKVLLGKSLKANIRLGARSFKNATLLPESFDRYKRWKRDVK